MWNLMPILRLLKNSWEAVDFKYDRLTIAEKACLTREEHATFVDLIRAHGLIPSAIAE